MALKEGSHWVVTGEKRTMRLCLMECIKVSQVEGEDLWGIVGELTIQSTMPGQSCHLTWSKIF